MDSGVASGLKGQYLVWQQRKFVSGPSVTKSDEVNVAIDQSGQHGLARVVEFTDIRSIGRANFSLRTHGPDNVVFDQDGGPLDYRTAGTVNERSGSDQFEPVGAVSHVSPTGS